MKVKFAPFGIGPTDLDLNVESIKQGGNKAVNFTHQQGIKAAEVSTRYLSRGLRKAADVLIIAADHVDDAHVAIIEHAKDKGFKELVEQFRKEREARQAIA